MEKYDAPYFPLKQISYEIFETQWNADFETDQFPSDLLIEAGERRLASSRSIGSMKPHAGWKRAS